MKNRLGLALVFSLFFSVSFSQIGFAQTAARFSGGVCASQGNWIQTALEQSNSIVNAIQTLKDDPNCKALVNVLENTPEITSKSIESFKTEAGKQSESFAGIFRELQAVNEFLSPSGMKNVEGVSQGDAKDILQFLLFRTSLDTMTEIQAKTKFEGLNETQRAYFDNMANRLRSFLNNAKRTAEITTSTTRSILSALPQSELCFQNKPDSGLLIFTALVNSGAALATGGEFTQLGPMVSAIVNYQREMKFMKNLKSVEYERYKVAVACLVESTQESYCALKDAQDALNFFRSSESRESKVKSTDMDPESNPMVGMIVLLRDLPVINAWFQKILFGIDPKLKVEAEMKNSNWDSIVSFIKQLNSLPATFRDQRQIYLESTKNASLDVKQAQVKELVQQLAQIIGGRGPYGMGGGTQNFFSQAMNEDLIPFYLMGKETFPAGFNPKFKGFETFFNEWTAENSNGLGNPDALVDTIEQQMYKFMDKANAQASNYFSQRMVVDPQNLITEGMVGPNVSPYKALHNLLKYYNGLEIKLNRALLETERQPPSGTELDAIKATIAMLKDTSTRIEKILEGMKEVSALDGRGSVEASRVASRKAMDVIYEFGNMLISRDSFISTRTMTALRMDISETLRRRNSLSQSQADLILVSGRDLISRLSRYFSEDPVVQRQDVSQAMPIADANLAAVEDLFGPVLYKSIQELNCSLKGGTACHHMRTEDKPSTEPTVTWNPFSRIYDAFFSRQIKNFQKGLAIWTESPSTDSESYENLRAKLCVQSLAFKSRKDFYELCRGAVLVSEFSDKADAKKLNANYDELYDRITHEETKNVLGMKVRARKDKASKPSLSEAQTTGVCAYRTYLRKNHIYRMYWSYQNLD